MPLLPATTYTPPSLQPSQPVARPLSTPTSPLLSPLAHVCHPEPRWRPSESQDLKLTCFPSYADGRIAPRSGLASKHFIDTGAGVIDADYRGQVKVLLFNHSDADFAVAEGERVAQLIIERIYTPEVVEVAELEESVRGAGGFGSTGKN